MYCGEVGGRWAHIHPVITNQSSEQILLRMFDETHSSSLPRRSHFLRNCNRSFSWKQPILVKRHRHEEGARWPVWCGKEGGRKLHRSAYLKKTCANISVITDRRTTETQTYRTHTHIIINRVSVNWSQSQTHNYIQTGWYADMAKWWVTLSQWIW